MEQETITVAEYLERGDEAWFSTGKKAYAVQAMMVSKPTSFTNDLEGTDYTVEDDGETVIIKGTVGEMWASKLSKVIATYTKPDGSSLSEADFAVRDTFVEIVSIPAPDTCYALFVPRTITVTVETEGNDVLHTNLAGVDHGTGDFLMCRAGADGKPDLTDVWVVNGAVFPNTYDTTNQTAKE